jgi:hypothetical protein
MTQLKLSRLKTEFQKAVNSGKSQFSIELEDGTYEFLTSYAKYMIEYLDGEYKRRGLKDSQTFELTKSPDPDKDTLNRGR